MQKRRLGEYRIFPLTVVMEQRLIIQYLTPVGEYQDVIYFTLVLDSLQSILVFARFKVIGVLSLRFGFFF